MVRYRPGRSRMVVGGQTRTGSRWLAALTALLAVALVVSLILGVPAIQQRQATHSYYISRMLDECDAAQREVRTLSRTASSNSAQVLSRIRSEVYTMNALSQAERSLTGKALVEESVFSGLMATIDSYFNTLMLAGTNTANIQSELSTQLADLSALVSALE